MKPSTIEKLIWILLYGGLIGVGLGLSIGRSDAALGWTIATCSGVVAATGAVLIFVRSRMREKP